MKKTAATVASPSTGAAKAKATASKDGAKKSPPETTASGVPVNYVIWAGTLINHNKGNKGNKAVSEKDNELPVVPVTSNVAPKMARKTGKYPTHPMTSDAIASTSRVDDEVCVVSLLNSSTQQISQDGDGDDDDGLERVKVPLSCPAAGCPHQILMVDNGIRRLFKSFNKTVETKGIDSGPAAREGYGICIYICAQHRLFQARVYAQGKGWPTDIDFASITPRVLAMKDDLHCLIYVEGLKSKNLAQRHFNKNFKEAYPNGDGFKALSGPRITMGLMADKARVG
jgi:hypothetical protein